MMRGPALNVAPGTHELAVVSASLAPSTSTRSAERVASLAVPAPVHPATPTEREGFSGNALLPDAVVATGIPQASTKALSSARARPRLMPLPARITGRFACLNNLAADSTLLASGRG